MRYVIILLVSSVYLFASTVQALRNAESLIPLPILNFLLPWPLASSAVGYAHHSSDSVAAAPWRWPFCGQLLQWRPHTIQLSLFAGKIERRLRWADEGVSCHGQPALDRQSLRSVEEWPSLTLQRELVRPQEQSAGTRHKGRHHGGEMECRIYCIFLSIRIGLL